MSDLYGSNSTATQLGNMRSQAVRDHNALVKQHNDTVSTTIAGLKDQVQNNATLKEAQDVAQNLWTGHGMPDKIKAYQDWRAAKAKKAAAPDAAPTPEGEGTPTTAAPEATQAEQTASTTTTIADDAQAPAATTTAAAPDEPVDDGSPAGMGTEEEAETLGSRLKAGISRTTGISQDALEEGLEKAGKGATVLGALGVGGMDAYGEYKSLAAGKGLSGDNWEEKSGNLLQLGGSISDIVGTFFPPAKLLGGVLDLSAGALDIAGQKIAEGSNEADLDTQETAADDQGTAQEEQQTATTGRTQ